MLNRHPNPPLSSSPPALRAGEKGYMLLGVLVLVAMLLIALAVAAPRVTVELQRDKEDELLHRGLQYAHAIRLYYKKFGRYPASLEQLEKTNEIRFLRKRYKDPITGKDEWRLIHLGEAKVKPTGLFGKPLELGGAPGANPGTAGTPGSSGSSAFGGASQTGLGGSTFGPASGIAGGGAFSSGAQTAISATDSQATSTADTTGGGGTGSGIAGASAPGTPASASTTAIGGSGQTFGGGGIVGVSSTSPKTSIREFKKQKHYNQWEFVYDPMQDRMGQNGTGIVQQPGAANVNGSSSPGFGPSTMGASPSSTPPATPPSSGAPQQ